MLPLNLAQFSVSDPVDEVTACFCAKFLSKIEGSYRLGVFNSSDTIPSKDNYCRLIFLTL